VNKQVIAGGVAVTAVAIGAGVVYCHQDFAKAAATGDFERAERRAGLLAINDIAPSAWVAFALIALLVGLSALSLIHQ
jgi:hypothetical protein